MRFVALKQNKQQLSNLFKAEVLPGIFIETQRRGETLKMTGKNFIYEEFIKYNTLFI